MHSLRSPALRRWVARLVAFALAFPAAPMPAQAASLALSQVPLFVSSAQKANVMLLLDNSNSMDEDATGAAVGSSSASSKSEIARGVAKTLIDTYVGKINMGLMAYQQSAVQSYHLHNSPYDASYNSANYNAAFTGARNASTKRYRSPNPTDPGNYIYYNVALPFYASTSQGNAFCYSPSSNPFADGENNLTGPWDSYRCFSSKTGTSDGVVSPLPGGGIKAAETALGYSGLIGSYTLSPTDSDFAQGITDFGKQLAWTYVGPTWFSNGSPGRGYVHEAVANLTASKATSLKDRLACNIPGNPAGCTTTGIKNAGLTPIEGSLLTARDYFQGNLSAAAEGGPLAAPPQSCGKDFVILLTDGLPSTDSTGQAVSNTTAALAAAADAAASLKAAGVKTYVVGFALPYGTNPSQLDTIAAAGGTGTAYSATDTSTLTAALGAIFAHILAQSGSGSAAATNSSTVSTNSVLYQAAFSSGDWSGRLQAWPIQSDGSLAATPSWMAGSAPSPAPSYYVPLPTASSRTILSYKPSSDQGIPFRWPANAASPTSTELDTAQTALLGSAPVLDYLRGDAANEGTATGQYRLRPSGKLGDIVNSASVYVGKPGLGYPDSFEGSPYSAFRSSRASRAAMIYVGANDGMLHGFDAATGAEKLAYVPNAVYANLANLKNQVYAHHYYVDGSPTVADAYYGGAWHSVLVGGLNGGGQGIYALDATDPVNFSEANAASIVRWEFGDGDDADLGYTYSRPIIARMANGKWAAIFGNGYNNTEADGNASSTGYAFLYVLDLETGALLAKISTKTGSTTTPNGLASPAAVDVDGDNIVDYVYAGDLRGNLWKFDVTGTSAGSWKVAYGSSGSPKPLFTAEDGSGVAQPITERPAVGLHPSRGGYMVYFGTGKYIETGDNATTGTQTQSFYGIWDKDWASAALPTRSDLLRQTLLTSFSQSGASWRAVSKTAIGWWSSTNTSGKKGWYMDLETAEKQVSDPTLRNGRVIFTTLTPSASVCQAGGTSWLMELDPETGGALDQTAFDVNGDHLYTSADFYNAGDGLHAVGGVSTGGGIAWKPVILNRPGTPPNGTNPGTPPDQVKEIQKSTNEVQQVGESRGPGAGRISWRELIGH